MSLPQPRYSIWQAISAALALATRAVEEVRALSRQPGPQGEPGPRGEPGFQIDEFFMEVENERTFVFKYRRGEQIAEIGRHTVAFPIYRGGFHHGKKYERGDMVTRQYSVWHCNEPTTEPPGSDTNNTNKAWTLAARKGTDGKDAPKPPPASSTPFGEK